MNSPTKWRAGAAASFTISSTAKNNSALFLLRILTSIIALLLLYHFSHAMVFTTHERRVQRCAQLMQQEANRAAGTVQKRGRKKASQKKKGRGHPPRSKSVQSQSPKILASSPSVSPSVIEPARVSENLILHVR